MTHADVWRAIERFAMALGMSCSGLARCSGLDPTTFNRSKRWSREGQPRWPSTNSISKILASTGASIQDFAKYIDVPPPENEQEFRTVCHMGVRHMAFFMDNIKYILYSVGYVERNSCIFGGPILAQHFIRIGRNGD